MDLLVGDVDRAGESVGSAGPRAAAVRMDFFVGRGNLRGVVAWNRVNEGEMTMRAMLSMVIVAVATLSSPAQAGEGKLDKGEIRKVVRAHIGEIRDCYHEGLERDPKLAGRLVVGFEIADGGAVERSEISESTLADAEVGACIAGAVKTWKFPAPQGGAVAVEYPFELQPG